GSRPSVPLAVKVTAGEDGSPVADVPVAFWRKGRRESGQETVRTDSAGMASLQPPAVDGRTGGEVSFLAEVAPAALVDDMSHLDIDMPQARFRCVLRSREQTRLSVRVHEGAMGGGRASDSLIADALEEELKSSGFRLQSFSGLRGDDGLWTAEGKLRKSKLASAARATADVEGLDAPPVAVAGTCRPRVENTTETSQGTLYFVSARVELHIIDPAFSGGSGRRVATIEVSEQGAYTDDRARAYLEARRKAADTCAQELVATLEARFE
ncbi:MAG: hypothetical protein V5A84_03995, partial [Planctomycetota bacterium]